MSADNWTKCPNCGDTHEKEIARRRAALNKSYGKVDAAEYLTKTRELEEFSKQEQEDTLREDYEQGIYEGKYYVSYHGSCTACDFSFEYKHEEVPVLPAPKSNQSKV